MLFSKNTNKDWESIGRSDPYYGVLTFDQYKSGKITKDNIRTFFSSGDKYVDNILSVIKEKLDPNYIPKNVLDFGCGVGRVLVPLSKHVEHITGVDVSEGMLKEAKKNCKLFSVDNVDLIQNDGKSIGINMKVDLIHSFIVFQHISINRGINLFIELIDHLEDNGIGVIHFTYHRKGSFLSNTFYHYVNSSTILSAIWNMYRGRSIRTPIFQMNIYDLNKVIRILQEKNCHNVHINFTTHGDRYYGVFLYFQKKQNIMNGIE